MSNSSSKNIARFAFAFVSAGVVAAAATWVVRNRSRLAATELATGESLDFPELRAHVYNCAPDIAFKAAMSAVESLPSFALLEIDEAQRVLIAEAGGAAQKSASEIQISCLPLGPNHSRVVIRSRAVKDRLHVGKNAAYIRSIQDAMDRMLTGG